jgi:hypothetical protein
LACYRCCMRKVVSILLAFLVLTSAIHFTIAKHYCSGNLAAVKFSLTGQKATCGMEEEPTTCPLKNSVRAHCCSDHLTLVTADQDNISNFSIQKISDNNNSLIFIFPIAEINRKISFINLLQDFSGLQNVFRTGERLFAFLCVFRI